MDALERLKQADPARDASGASRAQRSALAKRLSQRRPGVAAHDAPRRSFVMPIAIAAALAVAVFGFAQPTSATLAWSPTADTSPLAPSAELKAVCTEGMPLTAEQLGLLTEDSIGLVDTRGNASLVVWSTPALRLHCMLLRENSGALLRGPAMLSEPVTQGGAAFSIEFMAGTEWMNEMVMVLSGQAPEGTAEVTVVGQESVDFSASVNSAGQFAVWWPSDSGQVTGSVVARDAEGNDLDTRALADYFKEAGAREPMPTDDGATSGLPGDGMLDLERPLPSAGGGEGGFVPATISSVVVPSQVDAGQPLVVRFRAENTALINTPVVFIGGPSGWVTSWCGFGSAAVRVSGDEVDGQYEFSCLIPPNAPIGDYIVQIGCECVFPSYDDDPYDPWQYFSFKVVGGSTDSSAPEILDVAISSLTVSPGDTLEIQTLARDESGIAFVFAWVEGPNGRITNDAGLPWIVDFGTGDIPSEQDMNGNVLFFQTVQLRSDAQSGTYRIWYSVADSIGNREALYSGSFATFEVP